MSASEPQTVPLHGREVAYVESGSGPVLLLIHGMAGTCETWEAVIEPLARGHTVIATDLPGHGASAPGAGDYSLGSEQAHEAIAGSRLEVFESSGHMPQLDAPAQFVAALERFLGETAPAQWNAERWRARLTAASGR